MSFEIDDSNLTCTAAGIGGVLVPEVLTITEVCQDPDNLGIVYIVASIAGVYDYTPTLEVIWPGGTETLDALYIPSYKGQGVATFPIVTECATKVVTLAYDMGSVIPDFETVAEITLNLKFNGVAVSISENPIINQTFQSSNPSATYNFIKGLNPKPYKIFFDSVSGKLKVQYIGLGTVPCSCFINCVTPTEDDVGITLCEDEAQQVSIDITSLLGDPTKATLTFVDVVGNISNVTIEAMTLVKPHRPQALKEIDPEHIRVGILYASSSGAVISDSKVAYQVMRYENHVDSAKIWKDWSNQPTTNFVDFEVKSGKKYGYAVRFRGEFDEISELSDWTEVSL